MVKFLTSVPKVFIATPIDVMFKFREVWPTGNQWNRALLTWQKISPGSPPIATARIAPKICQGPPPTMYSEWSRFHPNRFTSEW